ncbi:hypothetical protein C0214_19755 [Methylobacterium sp. DM1]|nr:hypothetical protein C0214_19755 [Methylobacterium sp. DM1]
MKRPEMVERVARAIRKASWGTERGWIYEVHEAEAAIRAVCNLPEEPGPRYAAGEYSRKALEAFADDALAEPAAPR